MCLEGRELDVALAEALGYRVIGKDEATRASNEATKGRVMGNVGGRPFLDRGNSFDGWYGGDFYLLDDNPETGLNPLPGYSTSWDDAMDGLEEIRTQHGEEKTQPFAVGMLTRNHWFCNLCGHAAYAQTGPEAIAKAALAFLKTPAPRRET